MGLLDLDRDGRPKMLLTLWKALRSRGELSREQLLSELAPEPMGEFFSDKRTMLEKTLSRWTEVGVFEGTDPVSLCSPFAELAQAPDHQTFRQALLELILSEEGMNQTRDLRQALTWMLCQDIYQLPTYFGEEIVRLQSEQLSSPPLPSETSWRAFREWAAFLGFGQAPPAAEGKFVLDPCEVLWWILEEQFVHQEELAVHQFLWYLSERLPVFASGRYRTELEKELGGNWKGLRPRELSSAVSRGLGQLLHEHHRIHFAERPGARHTYHWFGQVDCPRVPGFTHIIKGRGLAQACLEAASP